MNKLKFISISILMLTAEVATAGGILTNSNQSVAFLRNPARDAAIAIDGVYSNPAGVVFLPQGFHLGLNIQNAHQTRTVTSTFAPFAYGADNNGKSTKQFEGEANAPILPSIHAAYNMDNWSLQFGFGVIGGGGKCTFDQGLGSFEGNVALLPMLSGQVDGIAAMLNPNLGGLGLPAVNSYKMDTYMKGRQYYFGVTLGAAYKLDEHWSVYGGLRVLYGSANYYGYVKNIQAGIQSPIGVQYVNASQTFKALAQQSMLQAGTYVAANQLPQAQKEAVKAAMLTALGSATEDVALNCDQTGWGVAPIIGVDYKTDKLNLAAKYEFKTRMRLKNKAANSASAANLEILNKYKDGNTVEEDSPGLLTVGAQWSVLPQLRLNAGYHHYFDKDATQYNNRQSKLDHDTNEYLFGVEYDFNKKVELSAGGQITRYGLADDYMEDMSFVVNSYSFGFGIGVHLTEKIKLNLAYFQTNYGTYNKTSNNYNNLAGMSDKIVGGIVNGLKGNQLTASTVNISPEQAAQQIATLLTTPNPQTGKSVLWGKDSFTRTNRVLGIGVEFNF